MLCEESLNKIVLWFFALDHINYARWIPIHVHDLVSLEECHPTIYAKFTEGNFVVKKSRRSLSAIAIDNAHEQNNSYMKKVMVELWAQQRTQRLCIVASGPEMAHLIGEFESSTEKRQDTDAD